MALHVLERDDAEANEAVGLHLLPPHLRLVAQLLVQHLHNKNFNE